MIEVGRLCVKIAGRDAGKKCAVVDVIDENYVLIDGETRRRKSNVLHLEPLDKTVDIKKGASHDAVAKAVESLGWEVRAATKAKKAAARPRKARRSKLAATQPAAAAPAAKPAAKKEPAKKPAAKPKTEKPARAEASAGQPTKSALPAEEKKA